MDRRKFLKRTSLGTIAGLAGGRDMVRIASLAEPERAPLTDDAVKCAIIGFGVWGREIASELNALPEIDLIAICDNYAPMLRRAQRSFPDAARYEDYQAVLDDQNVHAVLIATPTHLHSDIAVAALDAGKHVYCEAPMAHSVEDARTIAQAAESHPELVFQVGLHLRTEPQYRSVFQFIRSGAIGKAVMGRAQWHKKESLRRASPNRDREIAQNWRLDPDVSLGLIGEMGAQQLDAATWIFGGLPTRVTGFGGTLLWNDNRVMPDTVQAVIEFPGGQRLMYDATLASSFDGAYEMFYGSDSTIMLRDQKAWMFKEVDAPMLGWEVYARKDRFYKETGVALLANATKLDSLGQDPTEDDPNQKSPLWHALKAFAENFVFGPYPAIADHHLGFASTVLASAIRASIRDSKTVDIDPASYQL